MAVKRGLLIGVLALGLVLPTMAQVRSGHIANGAPQSSSRLQNGTHTPSMGDPSGGKVFTSPSIANPRPLGNTHLRNNFCRNGGACRQGFVGSFSYPFWGGALYWPGGFDYSTNSDLRDVVTQQQHIISELENEASQRRYFELRQQERTLLQDVAPESADPSPVRAPSQPSAAPETPTRLIFLDQHHINVNNYAIVGDQIYVLGPHTIATMKIPLSELDIPATTKANAAQGIDFHIPLP